MNRQVGKLRKDWAVVEKENPLAVHCLTWSKERAELWIETYGDSRMFDDKTLTKESFAILAPERPKP